LNSLLAPQYRILAATNGEKALSLARSEPALSIVLLVRENLSAMMEVFDTYQD
jgi:hypothetical protein